MTANNPPPARSTAAPDAKIRPTHLDRLAVVYVRQSTPRQVLTNQESTDLQYQLARRATLLGWHPDRVLVIDDDLGLSGTDAAHRAGFQRLLAELSLGHVGLVLGTEMSRLARSCKDWYQLLEVCALFGALLADQDGVYDPAEYNDRLLLGLRGMMSEAELHLIRGRMDAGRRNKAARGELYTAVPIGYVHRPGGGIGLDPDEQVRAVLRVVFDQFARLGSCRRVADYLRRNAIRWPVRPVRGPSRGQLEWHPPRADALYPVLRHPIYAGAYTYGRTRIDPRRKTPGRPGSGRVQVPVGEWPVLRRGDLPAYIPWEQYLANRERLRQNMARFETRGVARGGPALLTGLVVCGRCGWRMYTHHNHAGRPRYVCPHADRMRADRPCPSLAAGRIDELVTAQVLRALEPAAVSLSVHAAADLRAERGRLDEAFRHRVERARYEADRAKRQYDAVDPENRLVARELERRWEEAIRGCQQAEEEYARFRREQPRELTPTECRQVEGLATSVPALWAAPTTTQADRQEVIRHLVGRVVVTIRGETERVATAIHWAGGVVTEHEAVRAVGRYRQLSEYDRLRARVRELREAGLTPAGIAEQLNRDGLRAAQQGQRFTPSTVRRCLSEWGLSGPAWKDEARERLRGADEWWVDELVGELGVPLATLCQWCRKGWVHARKVSWPGGRWLIWADADDLRRLRRLKRISRRGGPDYPAELITPKPRPST